MGLLYLGVIHKEGDSFQLMISTSNLMQIWEQSQPTSRTEFISTQIRIKGFRLIKKACTTTKINSSQTRVLSPFLSLLRTYPAANRPSLTTCIARWCTGTLTSIWPRPNNPCPTSQAFWVAPINRSLLSMRIPVSFPPLQRHILITPSIITSAEEIICQITILSRIWVICVSDPNKIAREGSSAAGNNRCIPLKIR